MWQRHLALIGLPAEQDASQLGPAVEQLVQRPGASRAPVTRIAPSGLPASPVPAAEAARSASAASSAALRSSSRRNGAVDPSVRSTTPVPEVDAVEHEAPLVEAEQRAPRVRVRQRQLGG